MAEEWRDIVGWEGFYAVSSHGRVKSHDRIVTESNGKKRTHKGRFLTMKSTGKYHGVSLFSNGINRRHYVHRLVALTFIPNPEHRPEVNHKDGNKLNNHIANLEWATRSENAKHAYFAGLLKPMPRTKGQNHPSSKLTEHNVKQILLEYKPGKCSVLAKKYEVTPRSILSIINGRTWKHISKSG